MASTIAAGTSAGTAIAISGDTSGALQLQTNGTTTAVTIDTSQNVGIGTTAPTRKITLGGAGDQYINRDVTNGSIILAGGIGVSGGPTDAGFIARGSTSSFNVAGIEIYTAGAERMRIDSSGNVNIGITGITDRLAVYYTRASQQGITIKPSADTGGGNAMLFMNAAGTSVGYIATTASATTYATSSDYRLKDNIVPMVGALNTVAALKPVTYKWKVDGSDGQGFIAHELQEVVGGCVTGEKDATREEEYEVTPAVPAVVDAEGVETTPAVQAVKGTRTVPSYQGIDTSFLVATLTAAIQEAHALIIQLQADVAALKGVK